MLVPITREKFKDLIPPVATGDQYRYCWGKLSDVLRRFLISLVAVVVATILDLIFGEGFAIIFFIVGAIAGLYWIWAPVFWASQRNRECRRYTYAGFWRGRVLDKFITEELIGEEETVNQQGDLVIVENRERRLNLAIGDETGFSTQVQVPLKRSHRAIRRGDPAEMLVMSNRPDLSRILMISDVYLPEAELWVSDYPYLRRDLFTEVSRQLDRQWYGRDRTSA